MLAAFVQAKLSSSTIADYGWNCMILSIKVIVCALILGMVSLLAKYSTFHGIPQFAGCSVHAWFVAQTASAASKNLFQAQLTFAEYDMPHLT